MKKLDHKWLGPYLVKNAYSLKPPLSFGHIHFIFSVTLLRPYHMTPFLNATKKKLIGASLMTWTEQ